MSSLAHPSSNRTAHAADAAYKERMVVMLTERAGSRKDLWNEQAQTVPQPTLQAPPTPQPPKRRGRPKKNRQDSAIAANRADATKLFAARGRPKRLVTRLDMREIEIARVNGTARLPAKAIAKRLGRTNNSHLRMLLERMVERGALAKCPQGYCLPPCPVSRPHRLVGQVALHVHGEAGGRLMPPAAVLLHRLHHDPVQFTAHQLRQHAPRGGQP